MTPPRLVRLGLLVTSCISVFSAGPFLVDRIGYRFLSDPDVFHSMGTLPVLVAAAMALIVFVLLMACPVTGPIQGALRYVAPVFYALIFYVGLTAAVPMAWTGLMGKRAAMVVTVEHPSATPTSACRTAVSLDSMPWIFDRLCDVPGPLASILVPGDKVVLMGRRSSLGVFYDHARLLPPGKDI